jgi:hypothetical protein
VLRLENSNNGEILLSQTSRAKRLAVKAITGAEKARRRADQLIPRVLGKYVSRIIETAQAYAHRNAEGCSAAAPFTTDQQVTLDVQYAAAWNAYVDKHYPHEPRRAVVFGPHDAGGTRFVEKDKSQHGRVAYRNQIASVPLDAPHPVVQISLDVPPAAPLRAAKRHVSDIGVRELTDAEFWKLTAIYYYAWSARVDPLEFRAEASRAWESLRHRLVGKRVKDDLIARDRLDELADNQETEFWRRMQRIRRAFDKQVRASD